MKMKSLMRRIAIWAGTYYLLLIVVLVMFFPVSVSANPTKGDSVQGFLQLDYLYANLSKQYSDWRDIYFRGYVEISPENHIDIETSRQTHFNDDGVLYGLRYVHILNADWYGSIHWAQSEGGFFLPKIRLDADISRKWLSSKKLISTLSYMFYRAKDSHEDHAVQGSLMYYFSKPIIIEVGLRRNMSNPGSVIAWRYYAALTYGKYKHYYLILNYNRGREAYQLIGVDELVSDFKSDEISATWRQWWSRNYGLNAVLHRYKSTGYTRWGIMFGMFYEF